MTIAVEVLSDTSLQSGSVDFNYQCFSILAKTHPEISFIFICDDSFETGKSLPPNVSIKIIKPLLKNSLFAYLRQQFTLPTLLKKEKVDHFFGYQFVKSGNHFKQHIIFQNDEQASVAKMKNAIDAVDNIITHNEYLRNKISPAAVSSQEKNIIISLGMNKELLPYQFSEKEAVKMKFSGGKEYFLLIAHTQGISKIITLLKAFSIFKKWQQSNMNLLIVCNQENYNEINKAIENYKYKESIALIRNEIAKYEPAILGSAYTTIFIQENSVVKQGMLDAVAMEVPMLLNDAANLQATFNKAAVYCAWNETAISKEMILLYKDELYRNEIIEAAKTLAAESNLEKTAALLWQMTIDVKK